MRTTIGRQVHAVNGDARAAKLSDFRTKRLPLLALVDKGVLAALAGLLVAARLNTNAGPGSCPAGDARAAPTGPAAR